MIKYMHYNNLKELAKGRDYKILVLAENKLLVEDLISNNFQIIELKIVSNGYDLDLLSEPIDFESRELGTNYLITLVQRSIEKELKYSQ